MRRPLIGIFAAVAIFLCLAILFLATILQTQNGDAGSAYGQTSSVIALTNESVMTAISSTQVAKVWTLTPEALSTVTATLARTSLPRTGGGGPGLPDVPTPSPVPGKRIIIKNANLNLTVEDPAHSVTQVIQLVESSGGWLVEANTSTDTEFGVLYTKATLKVRVPADQLESLVAAIKKSAISVDYEQITGEDVTEEYVDLSSQLANLKVTQARLQKIMDQATNVEDVLNIERELSDVQLRLETIEGRLKYFDQAAAFSLITLQLAPKVVPPTLTPTLTRTPTATPTDRPLGLANWGVQDVARSAVSTSVAAGQIILTLFIWAIVIVLTIGLPVAILAFVALRVRRFFQGTPPSDTEN